MKGGHAKQQLVGAFLTGEDRLRGRVRLFSSAEPNGKGQEQGRERQEVIGLIRGKRRIQRQPPQGKPEQKRRE